MTALTHYPYRTPLGRLTVASDGQAITAIAFGERELPGERRATELTNRAANQLQEYLAGKRRDFDLPLACAGTDFQKRVWDALCEIPYGQTRSYSEIAAAIGSPKACRAVGGANNRNPIPIVVPCHRVIGANGSLVGYAGGEKVKAFLLDLERRAIEADGGED
ncbi:MAG: methylated-DNA--[protein]-cysteine S-methyltransferase [Eggerthellaceae bacterium]